TPMLFTTNESCVPSIKGIKWREIIIQLQLVRALQLSSRLFNSRSFRIIRQYKSTLSELKLKLQSYAIMSSQPTLKPTLSDLLPAVQSLADRDVLMRLGGDHPIVGVPQPVGGDVVRPHTLFKVVG